MTDPLRVQLDVAGSPVASDDSVLLYHATSPAAAASILAERRIRPAEGERHIYVSTSPAVVSDLLDSEVVIPLRVRIDDLAEWRDLLDHDDPLLARVEYAVSVDQGGTYTPKAIGRRAYDTQD